MDHAQASLQLHKKHQGKMSISSKVSIDTLDDLSTVYSPGVAEPCKLIAQDPEKSFSYTWRGRTVAVITDGSAVLGLGNIGPEASLPVMEGKCLLFKKFGGVDAIPLCLDTQDTQEIIETIVRLSPSFGGINLEDISAPRCFEIEKELQKRLNIPVFHDDQHGTAIVVLGALLNALHIVNKSIESVKIVISGGGSAGIAIAQLLFDSGAKNIVMTDSKGVIGFHRMDLNFAKREVLSRSSLHETGTLQNALHGADVFLGVSKGGLLTAKDISTMNTNAIVFAMANPTPEIFPEEAEKGGAKIIATGRSDYPNQVNNVLAFPGIFKGIFQSQAKAITKPMYRVVAEALAKAVPNPSPQNIIPSPLDPNVADIVANALQEFLSKQ